MENKLLEDLKDLNKNADKIILILKNNSKNKISNKIKKKS